MKDKYHMIILTAIEKAFGKIHLFMINTVSKLEGTYHNIIKAGYSNLTASFILKGGAYAVHT